MNPRESQSYKENTPISNALPGVSDMAKPQDNQERLHGSDRIAANDKTNEKDIQASQMNNIQQSSYLSKNKSTPDLLSERYRKIPERVFMNSLIKHTVIALLLIIPIAIYITYVS